MTNEIITAYKNNEPKFKDIQARAEKMRGLNNEKSKLLFEFNKIYGLVFRNFSNRIITGIIVEKKNRYRDEPIQEKVVLTKDGIFVKQENDTNAHNIGINLEEFFNYINEIDKKKADILPLLKDKKKDIFSDYIEIIKGITYNFEFGYPAVIEIKNESDDDESYEYNISKAESIESSDSDIVRGVVNLKKVGEERYSNVSVINSALRDKLIIEQIYEELVKFYEKYEEEMSKIIADYQERLKKLNDKFYAYLMLGKIKDNR